MAASKVSLAFLEEPVPTIISKTKHIAEVMVNNDVYKSSPISAQGLKSAVEHLRDMEKKARGGHRHDVENRDIALGDVVDFIQQIADFMNHSSDPRKLENNGFDFTIGDQKSTSDKRPDWTGGLI